MLDWSDFSQVDFFDSTIEPPRLVGNDVFVNVRNISIVPDPMKQPVTRISVCTFQFINVGRSVRHFTPYAVDQFTNKYLAPVEIVDCCHNTENELAFQKRYEFEGLLTDPVAWIDNWTVDCERIEVLSIEYLDG